MASLLIIIDEVSADDIRGINFKTKTNYSLEVFDSLTFDEKDKIDNFIEIILGRNQSHDKHLESLEHIGSIAYLKESTALDSIQLSESDEDDGTIEIVFSFSDDTSKQELLDINFSILIALNLAGHSLVTGTLFYDELEFLTSLKKRKLQLIYIGASEPELLPESSHREKKSISKFVLE